MSTEKQEYYYQNYYRTFDLGPQSVLEEKFVLYHPYETFDIEHGNWRFYTPEGELLFRGKEEIEEDPGVAALHEMADEVYYTLPYYVDCKAAFDELFGESLKNLEEFRADMMQNDADVRWMDGMSITETPNPVSHMPYFDLVDLAWTYGNRETEDAVEQLHQVLAFACLLRVDEALFQYQEGESFVVDAMAAARLREKVETSFLLADHSTVRSQIGAKAARARYLKDPKQDAKRFVHECWLEWKKNPSRYARQYDFAVDMMKKVPAGKDGEPIISPETITKKWIPLWNRLRK